MIFRNPKLRLLISAIAVFGCDSNAPAPPRSQPSLIDAGDYAPGPYGVTNGDTIADISWSGWRDPEAADYDPAAFETISLSDYYDPTGDNGYKAIFVNASARWCSICKMEQRHIRDHRETWEPRGVVFIEALFEDTGSGPAQPEDLVAWGKVYQINWALVLDPQNKLGKFFDRAASPMNMIIDARTMRIRDIITGMPDDSWWNQLGDLAQ